MHILDSRYPQLESFLQAQLAVAGNQEKFFRRRFAAMQDADIESVEAFAGHIGKLVGDDLDEHVNDYAWLCDEQINEELQFRRNGQYRLKSFEEAYRLVYSNKEYMTRYMNGLLMTQLWWSNHTEVMRYYREKFLPTNPEEYSHLEIGPGHGLFLYFAASDPRSSQVTAWDISEASIALTAKNLGKLGVTKIPHLELQDLFSNPSGSFDSLVFSEVLEHMEKPRETLEILRALLSDRGRLFINMPINSPAPDHLFNCESPEALAEFIEGAGLGIVDRAYFAATNKNLDEARRKKLTISCVFVVKKQ